MSATKKLRLGPLPKTESIKLAFACPSDLPTLIVTPCCMRRPMARRPMQRR
ncbi:hypothetical protein [Xanthomonas campestris]|uniref:hypothetical protein n=1 Tax=Xanthomonas campestris TaxID=339 RepID=UPI003D18E644